MREQIWQMANIIWNHCCDLRKELAALRAEREMMADTHEDLMEQRDDLHDDANIAILLEMVDETARRWWEADDGVQVVEQELFDYWNLYCQVEVPYYDCSALLIEARVEASVR